jgi:hypothetical protein
MTDCLRRPTFELTGKYRRAKPAGICPVERMVSVVVGLRPTIAPMKVAHPRKIVHMNQSLSATFLRDIAARPWWQQQEVQKLTLMQRLASRANAHCSTLRMRAEGISIPRELSDFTLFNPYAVQLRWFEAVVHYGRVNQWLRYVFICAAARLSLLGSCE